MENLIPIPQGGAEKRPGTKFIAEVKTSNLATRLLPFEFSTTQSYIIETGNQYMRFFTNGTAVLDGVGTADISGLDNILAHWMLNEDNGTVAVDDDGATHNGTISVDAATVTAEGKVNSAFDLDGQYDVTVSDSSDFSFTDNSNDSAFSLVCWAYVEDRGSLQTLTSKWRDINATREWRFSLSDSFKPQLHLSDTSSSLTGDMVSQWKLNEDAGNTSVVDAILLQDGVSTVITSTLAATGIISGAFDMDAQYAVEIADNAAYSFGDGTNDNPFSLSAWVFVTGDSNIRYVAAKFKSQTAREWALRIDADQTLVFTCQDESVNAFIRSTVDNGLATGWHHVVATYTAVTQDEADITLYVDGVAVNQTREESGSYIAMENTATEVTIGAKYASGGSLDSFFDDKIDNVIIFDKAISQAEVSTLYNSGDGIEDPTGIDISSTADDAVDIGWHYFVVTYSAPADETTAADGIILYVDGIAVATTATNDSSYVAMQNGVEELRIGSYRNSGDTAGEKFWGDRIDEVSVYNDVLTPTEVASLFSTTQLEIVTPYLTADLFNLKFEQSADILYITHPDYETRKLSRLANAVWKINETGVTSGPFRTQNLNISSKIAASATTGTVTLTATGTGNSPFVLSSTTGHSPIGSTATSKSKTGALFQLVHPLDTLSFKDTLEDDIVASSTEGVSWMACGTLYKGATWNWVTGGTWLGTVAVQRNYTIGAAFADTGWETVFSFDSLTTARNVTTSGTESDGDADYRVAFLDDTSGTVISYFTTDQTEVIGIVEITSVTSSTEAIGTVVKTLASTDATYKWAEGAWSNYRGWAQTVSFFEDRLMFGGNTSQPDTIWGSVTGDYENMEAGPDDDEAVVFTLSSRQVNVIEWLVGKDKLLIGTSGAEWTIAGGTDQPLTPSNVIAKQHSTYGSANLQATLANESVLFFQRGAEKMRELAYNWESDSYVAPDMTILASLVTDTGITDTAFQRTPNSILWTTRTDGEMPIFSYERAENVTAWSRMITQTNLAGTLTDSDIESVAVINGSPEDEVWVIVERTIGGSVVRYIEQLQQRDFGSAKNAFFVDSGVTYDSTATTTITGLSHLEGQTVAVLGDGVAQANKVVSSGQITIDSASTVQVGLLYEAQLRTMPLSWLGGATIHGKTKRISEVVTDWYKSGDFSIGRDANTLQTYSITGQTTSVDRKTFPPGLDRNGYIFIYQKSPEPLTVLAISGEFNVQ